MKEYFPYVQAVGELELKDWEFILEYIGAGTVEHGNKLEDCPLYGKVQAVIENWYK